MSFLVNRPKDEPGFALDRQEVAGRMQRYSICSYSSQKPKGSGIAE